MRTTHPWEANQSHAQFQDETRIKHRSDSKPRMGEAFLLDYIGPLAGDQTTKCSMRMRMHMHMHETALITGHVPYLGPAPG
jgi:hypothetical protein